MRILIIRHGDPDYEHDGLTGKGKREAALLAERLEKENITAVYCSPLGRAKATAAPTLARVGLTPVICDWLREFPSCAVTVPYSDRPVAPWNVAPGYWSSFPEHFPDKWYESPLYRQVPAGDVAGRIWSEFDALLSSHGYRKEGMLYHIAPGHEEDAQTLAFFCHLGLGNCLLSHIAGVPLPQWWHTVFLPTSSVTTVLMERHIGEKPEAIARIIGLGDTSHLYAGGEPASSSGLHHGIR